MSLTYYQTKGTMSWKFHIRMNVIKIITINIIITAFTKLPENAKNKNKNNKKQYCVMHWKYRVFHLH